MADISNIVKSLQNIMWKDPGVSGDAQRIEQLGWMITLKILDDKDAENIRKRFHLFFQEITKRFAIERRKNESKDTKSENISYTPSADVPFSKEVANLKQEDFIIFSNLFANDNIWSDFEEERDRLISSGIFSSNEKNQKSVGKKIVITDLAGRQHTPRPIDDIPDVEKAAKILGDKISGKLSTQKIFASIV